MLVELCVPRQLTFYIIWLVLLIIHYSHRGFIGLGSVNDFQFITNDYIITLRSCSLKSRQSLHMHLSVLTNLNSYRHKSTSSCTQRANPKMIEESLLRDIAMGVWKKSFPCLVNWLIGLIMITIVWIETNLSINIRFHVILLDCFAHLTFDGIEHLECKIKGNSIEIIPFSKRITAIFTCNQYRLSDIRLNKHQNTVCIKNVYSQCNFSWRRYKDKEKSQRWHYKTSIEVKADVVKVKCNGNIPPVSYYFVFQSLSQLAMSFTTRHEIKVTSFRLLLKRLICSIGYMNHHLNLEQLSWRLSQSSSDRSPNQHTINIAQIQYGQHTGEKMNSNVILLQRIDAIIENMKLIKFDLIFQSPRTNNSSNPFQDLQLLVKLMTQYLNRTSLQQVLHNNRLLDCQY